MKKRLKKNFYTQQINKYYYLNDKKNIFINSFNNIYKWM